MAAGVRAVPCGGVLPEGGVRPREALGTLVRRVTEGAAGPADPLCAARPHSPPPAAAAAGLAASSLGSSPDSWDQAPAASESTARTCRAAARPVYGGGRGDASAAGADALVDTGGAESNLLGVGPVREGRGRDVRVVCGADAHHSVHRAAGPAGLAEPLRVPAAGRVFAAEALRAALQAQEPGAPGLVVATAGTNQPGAVGSLDELVGAVRAFGARLHVAAGYGGMLLFSGRLRSGVAVVEWADLGGGAGEDDSGTGAGAGGRGGGGVLWLKAVLLGPYAGRSDPESLLKHVRDALPSLPAQRAQHSRPSPPARRGPRPPAPVTSSITSTRSHLS